jgi:GR25 family glycosyltransferase involved in LPS biosynthesis
MVQSLFVICWGCADTEMASYHRPSKAWSDKNVVVAILAKDKAHCLPRYLKCLENQTWPKSRTLIYVRTNNNNDTTRELLEAWVETQRKITRKKDGRGYMSLHMDATDVETKVQQWAPHEWNGQRFKVLGAIRRASVEYAMQNDAHYFVADCDNFIAPSTLETMCESGYDAIAPVLTTSRYYSNFHFKADKDGYMDQTWCDSAMPELKLRGIVECDTIHCTYFLSHDVLKYAIYDDGTGRYEYAILADQLRKAKIAQYMDNRVDYGRLTLADDLKALEAEPWIGLFPLHPIAPASEKVVAPPGLSVTYGGDRTLRMDVTQQCCNLFLSGGVLTIPSGCDFNACFGDHRHSVAKTLEIVVNTIVVTSISEKPSRETRVITSTGAVDTRHSATSASSPPTSSVASGSNDKSGGGTGGNPSIHTGSQSTGDGTERREVSMPSPGKTAMSSAARGGGVSSDGLGTNVRILSASYGAYGSTQIDVTSLLLKLAAVDLQGRLSLLHIPPKMLGPDPSPGVPKRLIITYAAADNLPRHQEVREYDCHWLNVPAFLGSDGGLSESDGGADSGARENKTRVKKRDDHMKAPRKESRNDPFDGKMQTSRNKKDVHPLNVFFQKVFVINLARATDRRHRVTETCRAEGLEIEFVEAIDGHRDKISYIANPKHGVFWNAGAAALVQTTLQLLQRTLRDPSVEQIVVLEDDIYFTPDAKAILAEALPTLHQSLSWDLLYLGHGYIGRAPVPLTTHKHLKRMQRGGGLGTYAYCIHRSVIPHLIAKLTDARDPLDVIYADEVFNRDKSYTLSPLVAHAILTGPSFILNPEAVK